MLKLLETYKTAVFEKDLETFCSLFDQQVRVFDMWQQWSYEGLPAWREVARGWFASLGTDRDRVTFEDVKIEETGDLAVATGIVRFTAVSAEGVALRYLEERFTWIGRREGEGWRIVHQHMSGPIDFSTMKVMLTK